MNAAAADHAVTHRPKAARRSSKAAVQPALKLDADLGIEQTASLREQLAGRIDAAAPVLIDASEVQRLHTASLQLLLMFCQSRYAAGRQTVWHHPSPSLQAAAKVLGLAALLGTPS